MKKRLLFIFYIVFIIISFIFIRDNISTFKSIKTQNLYLLIPYTLLAILQIFFSGLTNKVLYGKFLSKNSIAEGMRFAIVNTLGNYFPVSIGFLAKGIYAKKAVSLPYSIYFYLSLYQFSATFLVSSISAAFIAIFSKFNEFFVLSLAVAIFSVVPFFNFHPLLPNKIKAILDQKEFLKLRRSGFLQYPYQLFLQTMIFLINIFKLKIIFYILQSSISLLDIILIFCLINITRYISITPGGIGIKETVASFTAKMIGDSFSLTFIAIALDRIIDLLITVMIYPFFLLKKQN